MARTGKFLGMPYDWRRPTLARVKSRWWNADEPRLFTPAVAVIDFQLMHSSRITPPTYLRPPVKDWLFEKGEESQNTPEFYTVAFLIASGT